MDRRNAAEYGFLLLTSKLGNPERKPLTVAQFRELFIRSEQMKRKEFSRDVDVHDLVAIGYGYKMAGRIVELLQDEALLQYYLEKGRKAHCIPITRGTDSYPLALRKRLGLDSPGVLWAKGDTAILETPALALVGSRELHDKNRIFAAEVGRQAALQGYTLVSGNARGADKTAQNACLQAGGKVISVVADSLESHKEKNNILYLSEDGFDEGFSAQRALSRNRIIHGMAVKTFVAQSRHRAGGTWDGTVKNLHAGWSDVYCYADGSAAMMDLIQMGATPISIDELTNLRELPSPVKSFL